MAIHMPPTGSTTNDRTARSRPAIGLAPFEPVGVIVPSAHAATAQPAWEAARYVIIEGDDLGLLYAFNEGIRAAFRDGRLTSTCLRANGYAFEHAVQEILPSCPKLGVGVHLCLNESHSIASPRRVRSLVGPGGDFRPGYLWLIRRSRSRSVCRQIEYEFRGQIEKVLASGVRIDHLNSHQHVHMIPPIFRIVCRLAERYGVPCVRLARELPHSAGPWFRRVQPLLNSNRIKHRLLNAFARLNESIARDHGIITTDYFVGVNYTSHMDLLTIKTGLRASPSGSVEVLLHPAIGPDPRDVRYPTASLYRYVAAPQRRAELQALGLRELSDFLHEERWMSTDFADLASIMRSKQPPESTPEVPEDARRLCESVEVPGPPWVSAAQLDSRAFTQLVLTQTAPGQRVLDIGTGTGIIAICLARLGRQVTAADISGAALRTARKNARRNGVTLETCRSDLLASVPGRFDAIAFNPPYNFRPDSFATNVAKNVVRRVPLVRRGSGLAMPRPVLKFHQQLIERLFRQAPDHLVPGGKIILHAYESEVAALMSVLPPEATVELLRHSGLVNRTVGMVIHLADREAAGKASSHA